MNALVPIHSSTIGCVPQAMLAFQRAPDGRSYIARQQVGYPFHLGRQLRLPDDVPEMAAVYLQSCSGGVFAGEQLHLHISAGPGSLAHVASGAATVAHSMREAPAQQRISLDVERDAWLEYLPMATILFPHTRLHNRVDVTLHSGARLLLCDAFCTHAPSGQEGVFGEYRSDVRVQSPEGDVLVADRLRVEGAQWRAGMPGVSGPYQAWGNLMLIGEGLPVDEIVTALRAGTSGLTGTYLGVSALPNDAGVGLRLLAEDAVALREALHQGWASVRQWSTGIRPRPRRK